MTDVSTELHPVEPHQFKSCVGACEGLIKVCRLGDLRQHPSSGSHHLSIILTTRPGMKQLPLPVGIRLQLDQIPLAWSLGIALSGGDNTSATCLLYTSDAADEP